MHTLVHYNPGSVSCLQDDGGRCKDGREPWEGNRICMQDAKYTLSTCNGYALLMLRGGVAKVNLNGYATTLWNLL